MSVPVKKMHLNLFVLNTGHHEASWRHPETMPKSVTDIHYYTRLAQMAEQAKLDSLFIADALVLTPAIQHKIGGGLEPLTMLSALAMGTERIGLIGTVSTTYTEPYNAARMFASLDHISGGRAGWNSVTSVGDVTAINFGRERHPEHSDRYEQAKEFLEVVKGLWSGWEADALVADKQSGTFADYSKIHPLRYKGNYFSVHGPLNVARSPQVFPVLVQAGSSDAGKELAAETAELVFTAQDTLEHAKAFYADLKGRMAKYGRHADELKILPGFSPIIGATESEAREKEAMLAELITPDFGLIRLSNSLEIDLHRYPLEGPVPLEDLPSIEQVKGQKARFEMLVDMVKAEQLTIRQLIHRTATARGHYTMVGTPEQVADVMEQWVKDGAADGFNVMPPYFPGGLEDFVGGVVPELQRRGLFRTEYSGRTLREHFGLKHPDAQPVVTTT
ncbi:LLM class flavin-dependent oxidoreductase [Paenibacillus rigui]|uniref:LLM class flavin-dependent oxidoreductase n=1 Tax=Paenibacillus rigui TaxID=554312 RepID=A0A229ULA1_9BACL|nr:LLM class flavin-dependent oxidoreductase [Paenibacillus rigui]OXM84186.1 LLM class flavin-dependent oxidoreductase [Paenibacillus rigui]